MENKEIVACFPQIGDYHVIAGMLLEGCLNCRTMICPATTKRTVEIGSRNSPDMICTPFKLTLGNFIEAAEKGANLFVMPGAGCRLGFYDILQKQVLLDMGYDIDMLPLFDYLPTANRLFKSFKEINPDLTLEHFSGVLDVVVKTVIDMDELANFMRRNMAFEVNKGELRRHYNAYLDEVKNAGSVPETQDIGAKYKDIFHSVKINKPEKPIKIGIIGEIYAVIEPFANCYLEKWLTEHEVEIIRPIDLTRIATALFTVDEQIENSGGYVTYNIGSTANDAIAIAYEMVNNGIDGIIHVKPASCSPEITLMSILQNISRDYNVPIVYLTFDTETSEAGLHTRLEAFHDMIVMKGTR